MTPFLYAIFAESNTNTTLHATTETLNKLAEQGLSGVLIALILAGVATLLIMAAAIFGIHYLEVRRYERREIERDTQLAAIRIEENDSRTKLAETQTALTDNVESLAKMIEDTSKRLNDNIKDVKIQVENLSDGIDDLKETVDKHEKDITRHEGLLQEYSADYQPQIIVKKRVSKKEKAK